ncbi:MAG TPA: YceI family protein [Myxococcales bacterium LLY-WYZ-16_1]|jgi:polyisoprenoid-binding protein YceI|nr:YceI family protein [Myxococcales bacterium LLY-WYZ-16_1]
MKMKFDSIRSSLWAGALLLGLAVTGAAQAATYEIDPSHTFVLFEVKHLGVGKAHGMFRKTTGKFDPDEGMLKVSIDANSLYTANKKRDDHLRGPDFFNTKQFPKITFESTKVKKEGDKLRITGDLTIKGKTKSVELMMSKVGEGKDPWGNFRAGYEGSVVLDRMDFGVDYMPDGLSKDVKLTLAVEGVRK